MRHNRAATTTLLLNSLVFTTLMITAGQAGAVVYNLCTGTTTKTMPDGVTTIEMWGYGTDTGASCTPTVPGPQLTVPPGDTVLTINLRNELAEPVSVIVPGLSSTEAPAPVTFTDAQGRTRARSFVKETASGAMASYSFNARPGTFLYHSGTHPAVQVQMGLYGAVTGDAAAGEAYPGVTYDTEVVILYSEIDPALHAAVDSGDYGTAAYPSTINYSPKYYLVNGEPYSTSAPSIPGGDVGQRTLIRFLNAGLESHAPTLLGEYMSVVAEYGSPYPYPREQYSLLLTAQQTRDAVIEPAVAGDLALYDRRLRLTNNTDAGPGGLISFLTVGASTTGMAPVAADDALLTDEDTPSAVDVTLNDSDSDGTLNPATVAIATQALNGIAVSNGDGTVTYTPNLNFNGADSFTYNIRDNDSNLSNTATVSVMVNPVNDAPIAAADNFNATQNTPLNIAAPGVLANDSDVDGDGLTAVLDTTVTSGLLSANADGSFDYTPNPGFTGDDSFTYHANDGSADSDSVTVTISVSALVNEAPVANDDYDTVTRNIGGSTNSVTVDVTANDTDSDGAINSASVLVTTPPRMGSVVNNGDGTVTYTPASGRTGSDAVGYTVEDGDGAISNEAVLRIDVTK
jgi:FtsP/CotA-like multicopper oxidase with cupredoxin domain